MAKKLDVPGFSEAVNDLNSGVYKVARNDLKGNKKQDYVNFSDEFDDSAFVASENSTII